MLVRVWATRGDWSEEGSGRRSMRSRSRDPVTELVRAAWSALLRLQSLDVFHQVGGSLLHLGFVPLADAREQRSPDGHVLAAVRWHRALPADDRGHVGRRIFAATLGS